VADAALRKDGVIDARTDRYAEAERRPLSAHLDDWAAVLEARGNTAKHADESAGHVKRLAALTGAERISALTPSAVQSAIGELQQTRGVSIGTAGHYLRSVKSFTRWLHRDGRTRGDALACLTIKSAAADRRLVRRALDADEIRRLVDAAEHGPAFRGLCGADRAMIYRVAVESGLRRNELRSLLPADFRLDDDPPVLVVRAAHSKRRREDRQPIRRELADRLATWVESRPEDAPVFDLPEFHTSDMLRTDLRRARARWIRETADRLERRKRLESDFLAVTDAEGRTVDFHALRTSFITALVKGGASVKVAQTLARHSTPVLTLGTYTTLGVFDVAAGLDALPDFDPTPKREHLAATGTTDAAPEKSDKLVHFRQQYRQQLARETSPAVASGCEGELDSCGSTDARKSLPAAEQRERLRIVANSYYNAPGGTRTPDRRIRNPMLCPTELRALGGTLRRNERRHTRGSRFRAAHPKRGGSQPERGRPRDEFDEG